MPNIGYGTKKADRYKTRKTGKYSFIVRNGKVRIKYLILK